MYYVYFNDHLNSLSLACVLKKKPWDKYKKYRLLLFAFRSRFLEFIYSYNVYLLITFLWRSQRRVQQVQQQQLNSILSPQLNFIYRLKKIVKSRVNKADPAINVDPAALTPNPASATSFPGSEDMFSGASCEFNSLLDGESCKVFSSVSGPECCTPLSFIWTSGGSFMGVGSLVLVVVACVVVDVDVVVVVVVVGTRVPFSIQ